MPRRERNIRQRADDRWEVRVKLPTGKLKSFYTRGSYDDAKRLKAQKQKAVARGEDLDAERLKLSVFLERWLEQHVRPRRTWGTYVAYKHRLELHVTPVLGHVYLDKLTPRHVDELLSAKLASGLSPRTVQEIRGVLRTALNRALKWQLLTINPATLVDAPRVERYEAVYLDEDQAKALLTHLEGDCLEMAYLLALSLGLRRGEVLGLLWYDPNQPDLGGIDLDRGAVHLRLQPARIEGEWHLVPLKSKKSRATLPLPPSLAPKLRAWRARQLEERLRSSQPWPDTPLVFTGRDGRPVHPDALSHAFQKHIQAACGIRARFHDLRHSAATILLANGEDLKFVSELLRHTQISITADLYGHVLERKLRSMTERMDGVLWGTPQKPRQGHS